MANVAPDQDQEKASRRPPANGKDLPLSLELEALGEEGGGPVTVLLESKAMRAAYNLASQVAPADAPVLIQGESGTGKELFAKLLHTLSNRREKPFIPVNCGVLKGELFADKFFGHEPGAFTGASRVQKGSFELAGDGTLFLDEVGEIPPQNQVDFLRVLEQRTFRRLGGEKEMAFGARIVAATNRDLQEQVRRGEFRADLFYRLAVVPLQLPPLRLRHEDIIPLAQHFLAMFCHRYHKLMPSLEPTTLRAMTAYGWPGNVRELKNLIERLVLVHPRQTIQAGDLPPDMRQGQAPAAVPAEPTGFGLGQAVRQAEIRAIHRALAQAQGSKAAAAELLGISPRTLRHKSRLLGLKLR
jgi:two-component system response regulator AtoC